MIYWPANEFIKTLINTFINFQLKKEIFPFLASISQFFLPPSPSSLPDFTHIQYILM